MHIRISWGTGIAVVYSVFATATVAFVVFAMGRPVHLVSRDYYQQALQQDERMTATRNAEALGDSVSVVHDSQTAVLTLPRDQARAAEGTLTLYRPSDARADRQQPLKLAADGRQTIALTDLAPGRWVLQARWSAQGRDYYVERALLVSR